MDCKYRIHGMWRFLLCWLRMLAMKKPQLHLRRDSLFPAYHNTQSLVNGNSVGCYETGTRAIQILRNFGSWQLYCGYGAICYWVLANIGGKSRVFGKYHWILPFHFFLFCRLTFLSLFISSIVVEMTLKLTLAGNVCRNPWTWMTSRHHKMSAKLQVQFS